MEFKLGKAIRDITVKINIADDCGHEQEGESRIISTLLLEFWKSFCLFVFMPHPFHIRLHFFKKLFIYLFLYLFMAVLGLRFCARAFSSCGKWGPLFIAVRRPLTIAASLVAEHRLQTRRLSNCGSRA